MPELPYSGGSHPLEVVNQEGNSTSEVHDLCVCSTLYNTMPNLPATSGEFHNERHQAEKLGTALAFHELMSRP